MNHWEFSYQDKYYKAVVPGCIHTDLLNNKLISDPFWESNEDSVQWIAERDWCYRTTFDADKIKDFENAELVFEGLDTYTEVFLNGKPLLHEEGSNTTNNMFREWHFPIPKELKKKDNLLEIKFLQSPKIDKEKATKLPYQLPENRAFSRKAPYESGWDWGPKLITCGIWQPAYINLWNDFKITEYHLVQQKLDEKEATLALEVSIISDKERNIDFSTFLNGKIYKKERLQLQKGENTITKEILVKNPILWFPNGMGESYLYDIKFSVAEGVNIEEKEQRWGFRTVELVQQKDSIGKSFEFWVNGKPLFIKGANWIPSHSLISELSGKKGLARYESILKDCQDSYFNMIRIWGGGIYENETFYDLCDELGIMVWQDFIFCCALYPGDEEFINNVSKEAEYQIKRLRKHPSLVVWCGNNEVQNGWEDWGWQNSYQPKDRKQIGENMHFLFDTLLSSLVKKYDNRPYHPSSPSWGWGHPECTREGDSHYWGVWWGEESFEVWNEKTGRFMSEYGFQSYPEMSTILQFSDSSNLSLSSPALKNHQKHGRGVEIISKAIFEYYLKETPLIHSAYNLDLESFVYLSQITQAYGIGNAIEIHRYKRPHCMGTLYWQINDCWPVASWSSIDYYGNWKALQYEVKRAFAPIMITSEKIQEGYKLHLVSDANIDILGKICFSVIKYDGEIRRSDTIAFTAKADCVSSQIIAMKPITKELVKDYYLKISFIDHEGNVLSQKIEFFGKPLEYERKANVKMDVRKENNDYVITLNSDCYAHKIQLSVQPYTYGKFSNNYIDLEPHATQEIRFTPLEKHSNLNFTIKYYNEEN